MGISRKLNIIMRRPGGLLLLLTFISYSKCQVSIEGNCRYACNQDGSCSTDWNGSFKSVVEEAVEVVAVALEGLCTCQITSSGKQCVGIPQENVPSSSGSSGGSKSDGDCRYQCKSNGGCQVFSSSGSGSCFSQSFGGGCSGTPRGCQDCNRVLNC